MSTHNQLDLEQCSRLKSSMTFKRTLALLNVPLSKQPFKCNPKLKMKTSLEWCNINILMKMDTGTIWICSSSHTNCTFHILATRCGCIAKSARSKPGLPQNIHNSLDCDPTYRVWDETCSNKSLYCRAQNISIQVVSNILSQRLLDI